MIQWPVGGQGGDLAAFQRDIGQGQQALGNGLRKPFAIHRQGPSGGQTVAVAHFHDQPARLRISQCSRPDGILLIVVGTERVRTDHFGQLVGAMRESALGRAHFVQNHRNPACCRLPGRFRACQPAAYDVECLCHGGDVAPNSALEKVRPRARCSGLRGTGKSCVFWALRAPVAVQTRSFGRAFRPFPHRPACDPLVVPMSSPGPTSADISSPPIKARSRQKPVRSPVANMVM